MNLLNKQDAQKVCDKWAELFKIGSWKFAVELRDDVQDNESTFRYNSKDGIVTMVILSKEATEKHIVAMLIDFARLHKMLGEPDKENEHYIGFREDNIEEITNVILTLAAKANFLSEDSNV